MADDKAAVDAEIDRLGEIIHSVERFITPNGTKWYVKSRTGVQTYRESLSAALRALAEGDG